jgi:hypothetical protein
MTSNFLTSKKDLIITKLSAKSYLLTKRNSSPIDYLKSGKCYKENYPICAKEVAVFVSGLLLKISKGHITISLEF